MNNIANHEENFKGVIAIRCMKHFKVPPYNNNESTGAECPVCEVEKLNDRIGQLEPFKLVLDGICDIITEFPNTNENVTVGVRRIKSERDNLRADNTQLRKEVEGLNGALHRCRCIYCGLEVSFDEKERLADHIMSCEKSPVVQMVKEMESKVTDYMDLMMDEFARISTITKNAEIVGICQRAMLVIHQREPVIKQRDDAQSTLDRYRVALEKSKELLIEVAAYGNCDCDIPKGKTCVPCECSMMIKEIDALTTVKCEAGS